MSNKRLRFALTLICALSVAMQAAGLFLPAATLRAHAAGWPKLASSTTALLQSGNLQVTLTPSTSVASTGTVVTFTVTITNGGSGTLDSLAAIEPVTGSSITLSKTTLVGLGDSTTGTFTHTITAQDADPYIASVVVTATEGGNPLTQLATARVNIVDGSLAVIKSVNRGTATAGDVLTYTVTITNNGATEITNLSLTDSLSPSNVVFSSPTPTRLAAGATMTATYTHTVSIIDSDPLVNTVLVSGLAGTTTVSDTSSALVDILPATGGIRITLSADKYSVTAGDVINYVALITNTGTQTLTGVTASAVLPNGAPVPSLTLSSTAPLVPGAFVTATFNYTVSGAEASPLVATAHTEGTLPDTSIVTDDTLVSSVIPYSSIDVTLRPANCATPCLPVAGQTLTIRATLANTGTLPLTAVAMTSTLPITTTSPTRNLSLLPAQTKTIDFTYLVPYTTSNPLIIPVRVQGTDPNSTIVVANAQINLNTTRPGISVTLTNDKSLVAEGETVTYTATITNTGNESLHNIALLDSIKGIIPTPSITTLNPSASATVQYTYIPVAGDPDPLINTITVSAEATSGNTVTDNDTLLTNLLRPELFVAITASTQVAHIGERIQYVVTVINIGDGPISDLNGTFLVDRSTIVPGVSPRPSEQGGVVTFNSTMLFAGASTIGTFAYIPTSNDIDPLTMRVTVSGLAQVGTETTTVTGNAFLSLPLIKVDVSGNPIILNTPVPGLANPEITKTTAQQYGVPGGLITWTVTVRNPGTDPLTRLTITDTFDRRMSLETVSIVNGTIISEGTTITASTATLDFNDTTILTIITRINDGVFPDTILENAGCVSTIAGGGNLCVSAAVRTAPQVELLPATGQTAPTASETASHAVAPVALLLMLSGILLGLAAQNGTGQGRVALLVLAVVAVFALVTVLVVLTSNQSKSPEQAAQLPTASATSAQVEETTAAPTIEITLTALPEVVATVAPSAMPVLTVQPTVPPTPAPTSTPPFESMYEREVFIPRLGFNTTLPIVEIPLRNQTWDVRDLGQNVGFLEGTTWVTDAMGPYGGNTVLAAHIRLSEDESGPFLDLDTMEVGDRIYVAEHGTTYEYMVYEVAVVAPDDVAVTYPTREPTLTLLTCTTWNAFRGLFAERLIVRARPVNTSSS